LPVNVLKRLASSPTSFNDAVKRINEAIDAYTASIGDLGVRLGIEIFLQGREMQSNFNNLSDRIEENIRPLAGNCLFLNLSETLIIS
jgi:hypothetical protein